MCDYNPMRAYILNINKFAGISNSTTYILLLNTKFSWIIKNMVPPSLVSHYRGNRS